MPEKVCIIGAGAAGIAACRVLHERGIPFDCFEMSSGIGGLWRFENETNRSPAYASLHTNTSRERTAFADFPMPSSYPDFPHHSQMLEYFEAFIDHFGFRPRISFRTRVERVEPIEDGAYNVTVHSLVTGASRTQRYGAVLVASGHHWKPNHPSFPGSFDGTEMHSHAYRTPDIAVGKRVLVVGVGNSACDIVCEVSTVSEATFLSTRRGAHVIPKYILGRPLDTWVTPLSSRLPLPVRRALFRTLIFLTQGRQRSYGFPAPDYGLGTEHPTISSNLLPLVKRGSITPKPNIESLDGGHVRFLDGTAEVIDLIIYATGYVTSFPFLDVIEPRDNYVPLYLHVADPDHRNLFFVGFVQPLGANPPLAEVQAEWVADLLEGRAALPSRDEMRRAIQEADDVRRRRYVDSKRHRLEVDYFTYLWALQRERRKGRARASGHGKGTRHFPSRFKRARTGL